jgi:hypothetical protein
VCGSVSVPVCTGMPARPGSTSHCTVWPSHTPLLTDGGAAVCACVGGRVGFWADALAIRAAQAPIEAGHVAGCKGVWRRQQDRAGATRQARDQACARRPRAAARPRANARPPRRGREGRESSAHRCIAARSGRRARRCRSGSRPLGRCLCRMSNTSHARRSRRTLPGRRRAGEGGARGPRGGRGRGGPYRRRGAAVPQR